MSTSPWVALAAKREDPNAALKRFDAETFRPPPRNLPNETICVVDANAIVKGQNLSNLSSKSTKEEGKELLFKELVTTSAVLKEIKDEHARMRLQNDPNWQRLCVSEADEETVSLVKRFARLTGDIGQLSEPDVNVIALALKLEREKCDGDLSHIRTVPPPARKYRRKASKTGAKPLPGWDFVSNAEDWKELDEMNAEMERMEKKLVVGENVSERFSKIALEKEKLLQRGLEAKSLAKDDRDEKEREEEKEAANEEGANDKAILDLCKQANCVWDEKIEAGTSTEYVPACVRLRLKDGSTKEKAIMQPTGCSDNPMRLDEICERFQVVAAPLLTVGNVKQWLETALSLETLETVEPLMTLRTA